MTSDEATVAIENVHTHLARGGPLARAVLDASGEVVGPRLLAMLSVVAVFVPVVGPDRLRNQVQVSVSPASKSAYGLLTAPVSPPDTVQLMFAAGTVVPS